jgi:hypothetical protein
VAHIRTEFGFDVLQIASGRYAPDRYKSFIGFQVSRDVLERAFLNTYDIEMKDIFGNVSLALGSYRYAVKSIVPDMTRVAWGLKQEQLKKEIPGITRKKFLYNLSRSSYEKEWGREYHQPGFGTKILTFFFRILPSTGPFSALQIRPPTPEVEKMFMASFNASVDHYQAELANVAAGGPELPNENFDLGEPPQAGKYKGADEAYAKLVGKLAEKQFTAMSVELRRNILTFYRESNPPVPAQSTVKESADRAKLVDQLDRLKAIAESEQ